MKITMEVTRNVTTEDVTVAVSEHSAVGFDSWIFPIINLYKINVKH